MTVKIIPYLAMGDAVQAIDFYTKAFGANEIVRMIDSSGRVSHAEMRIGDVPIYLADEFPEIQHISPHALGGSPVMLVLDVEDADSVFDQAVAAGATVDRPLQGGSGGDVRNGKVVDPFGHRWMITTSKE
jgi:PhnB protein